MLVPDFRVCHLSAKLGDGKPFFGDSINAIYIPIFVCGERNRVSLECPSYIYGRGRNMDQPLRE